MSGHAQEMRGSIRLGYFMVSRPQVVRWPSIGDAEMGGIVTHPFPRG